MLACKIFFMCDVSILSILPTVFALYFQTQAQRMISAPVFENV